ncbi:MAG: tRNA pseudouridine(55) synthase TruB [Treponema sp.]|jgi:tRNA pseudouridine55 synthase|nr:tRNA pseudouridine(55) synthase TruB [Treponema sp.]
MPGGLLLLHKQPGVTSFESLYEVKRALGISRVGHTGTLDKFAEGLLPVLAGRAVKLTPWFSHSDKQYRGKIRFGFETDTLDPEGQTVAESGVPSREAVEEALSLFRGGILQAPPLYSAIHLDGRRASERARAGETPEMKKRPVSIYCLDLISWDPPFAEIAVHCSSGTYIRSLARDLARAAGSCGCLAALTRTRVAGFDLSQAVRGDDPNLRAALLPISRKVFEALGLPWFDLDEECVQYIIQGKPLSYVLEDRRLRYPASVCGSVEHPEAAGVFCGDLFAAVIEKKTETGGGTVWSYGYVYAAAGSA